jgi:hypothetical protein
MNKALGLMTTRFLLILNPAWFFSMNAAAPIRENITSYIHPTISQPPI